MRILFSFLLTLLTAAGTFFPCCMHDDCTDEPATQAVAADTDDHQEDEACSPFFACGTCPLAVEVARTPLIEAPVACSKPDHQAVYHVRLASFDTKLFQPPRLG